MKQETETSQIGRRFVSGRADEVDLRRLVEVIRTRVLWILGAVVVIVGGLLAKAASETPLYSSTAELLVQSRGTESANSGVENRNNLGGSNAQRNIATEVRVIESRAVAALANKRLGGINGVSASAAPDADVVRIMAVDRNAARASRIANTFAEKYIEYRKSGAVGDLLAAADELDGRVVELEQQITSIEQKLSGLTAAQASTRQTLDLTRVALVNQVTVLRNRSEGFRLDATLRSGGARIINRAEISLTPRSPKPLKSLVLGLILGLVVGMGLALAIELLDDKIASKEDLDRMQLGLPILGLIPKSKSYTRGETPDLESFSTPNSATAEAYRTLRSAVQFAGIERKVQVLLVTSSDAAESKSTTAANLAVTLARSGVRVCLVDADLRNPRLHSFFGISESAGLSSVLVGTERPPDAIVSFLELEELGVMPAGPKSPNPAELLGSNRMSVLLDSLKKRFDLVIVDSPPVLPVVDSLELSRMVDGILVATLNGRTRKRSLSRALELLTAVDAPILGVVLTGVEKSGGYGYGYGYGYEEPLSVRTRKKLAKPAVKPVVGLTIKGESSLRMPVESDLEPSFEGSMLPSPTGTSAPSEQSFEFDASDSRNGRVVAAALDDRDHDQN